MSSGKIAVNGEPAYRIIPPSRLRVSLKASTLFITWKRAASNSICGLRPMQIPHATLIAGMMQINFQVPADAPVGIVPLLLETYSWSWQGVTIAIK